MDVALFFSFLFSFSLSAASSSLEAVGFMAVRYSGRTGFSPTFSPMLSFLALIGVSS